MTTLNRTIRHHAFHLSAAVAAFALCIASGCGEGKAPAAGAQSQTQSGERARTNRPAPNPALAAMWAPVRGQDGNVIDFGEVVLNQPVTKDIVLVNHGDSDVRLRDSRTNCGCTTTDVAGKVIPANGTLALPIHFDAEGRVGERSATVDLFFEGWDNPYKFRVRAVVVSG